MHALVALAISTLGGYFAAESIAQGWVEGALVGLALVGPGIALLLRLPQIGARFDATELHLKNIFRSVVIPRSMIDDVNTDPRVARVSWSTPKGAPRTTTVSAAHVGVNYLFPRSTLAKEHQFLRDVAHWAHHGNAL